MKRQVAWDSEQKRLRVKFAIEDAKEIDYA